MRRRSLLIKQIGDKCYMPAAVLSLPASVMILGLGERGCTCWAVESVLLIAHIFFGSRIQALASLDL